MYPYPEVYFYDVNSDNALGAAFIVMDYLDGFPIPYHRDLQFDHNYEILEHKIVKQICRIAHQLYSMRFKAIGGIYASQDKKVIIGPKSADNGRTTKPFPTAKDYYHALTNDYWNNAVSKFLATSAEISESWTWDSATKLEKELFTANFHLQCLSTLDFSTLNNDFCLQHHDLSLRNILVDKKFNIVGVIDWDEASTIPTTGFDPVLFCPADFQEKCWNYYAEIERQEEIGVTGLSELEYSETARICRILVMALKPYREFCAPEVIRVFVQGGLGE